MSLRRWGTFVGGWLLLVGCANIRAPEGGPRDVWSPRLKSWTQRYDRKGHLRYTLRWNEFLDPGGEALSTLVWVNPTPQDSMPELWRRIRGKRLIVKVPGPYAGGMLWIGPGARDFTEKNPVSPRPLLLDTLGRVLRLHPPPSGKQPVWLLVQGTAGVYRFLAEGDSIQIAHLPDTAGPAYAFEDANGNALWDGAPELLWLPQSSESLFRTAWLSLRLDTFPPRPKQTYLWGEYHLLIFSEPVRAEGAHLALSENALLALDTSLTIYDSLGHATFWEKPALSLSDTMPPTWPIFWSWQLNSQSPWIYLSTPDTAVRPDTFLHLKGASGERLIPACQEKNRFIIEPAEGFGEGSLFRAEGRLPLRKAPVRIVPDSGGPFSVFWVYPPAVLGNSSPFLAAGGDTLWLVPGRYGLLPAHLPRPHITLKGRWPHLSGTPSPVKEMVVLPADSLQVVPFTMPGP